MDPVRDRGHRGAGGGRAGQATGENYPPVIVLAHRPQVEIDAALENHTGAWWNPDESGWGVNFAHQGDTLFATLFVYDSRCSARARRNARRARPAPDGGPAGAFG